MTAGRGRATLSVIIPAFNLETLIGRAIRSVLAQTSLPDEILVIDDGSTDKTVDSVQAAMAEAPKGLARLIALPHGGLTEAWNRGLLEARGRWTAFLDGDDLWLPQKVARLRQAVEERPDVGIITHDFVEVAVDGTETQRRLHGRLDPHRPLLPQLYRCAFFATSCMAVLTDEMLAAGKFDPSLPTTQDYDLWLKVARRNQALYLPDVLAKFCLREGSNSTRFASRYRDMARIAARHAPHVAAGAGPLQAYRLRLRMVLMAQYVALSSLLRAKRPLDAARMAPSMAADVARMLLAPIGAIPGDS